MKNKKIIKRKHKVKQEIKKKVIDQSTIKKKKLVIKETKEETLSEKILKMIKSKQLFSYAFSKILKCDSTTLHEIKEEVIPFLFNKLMIKENNVIYKILKRLLIVYDDKEMLVKYLKCFEYSNVDLLENIVRLVLQINPGLFSESKKEIVLMVKNERLKRELVDDGCIDNLKIINK